MVRLTSRLGAMLAFLCFLVAFVAGNPLRLPADKKDTSSMPPPGLPFYSYLGTRSEEHPSWKTKTGSVSHISHVSHDSTRTEKHHHKLTRTSTDAHRTSHHEHTRTGSHKSHETEQRTSLSHKTSSHETEHKTSLDHKSSSTKTLAHYTVEKREVSVLTLAISTAKASHEIPHPSHGPHTETHSAHRIHTRHSTHKEHSHTSAIIRPTNPHPIAISTTLVVHTTKATTVSTALPWWGTRHLTGTMTFGVSPSLTTITVPSHTHPGFHGPENLEARREPKSSGVLTFNPYTLPNATTIALPSTTYCVTSLYLPHSPWFGPSTATVWTSTATFYPLWDCHGCESLTVHDPWTMGQPTTHYHHTKTIKSVVTVMSPVCKRTSTANSVTAA